MTVIAGSKVSPVEIETAFQNAAAGQEVSLGKTDLAFGRYAKTGLPNADLLEFAKRHNAIESHQWQDLGFYDPNNPRPFDMVCRQVMDTMLQRGGKIKFNLDDVDVQSALSFPRQNQPMDWLERWTEWELQEITAVPKYFEATTFYKGGEPLTTSQLAALGIHHP